MWGRGRSEKAVSKDKCPQGRIYSKPRPGREDKGGGTGKDREGKKAPQHRRTAKVVGHGRVRVPKARIPAAQAGPGIALQAHRGVPILGNHADCGGRAVERWRGAGGGGEFPTPFRVITAVFFLPFFGTAFPPPWQPSEPSARTPRLVASGCPPRIPLCVCLTRSVRTTEYRLRGAAGEGLAPKSCPRATPAQSRSCRIQAQGCQGPVPTAGP